MSWIKIAESKEALHFGPNNLLEVEAGGRTICIALHQEQLFACAHKCPHASGRFVQGWIDALGNVVCPLHRYKFSLQNGRNVTGEGYYLKHWPIEVREDGVYVQIEDKGLFGLL